MLSKEECMDFCTPYGSNTLFEKRKKSLKREKKRFHSGSVVVCFSTTEKILGFYISVVNSSSLNVLKEGWGRLVELSNPVVHI